MRIYKVSWCASLSFKEALLHLSKNFIKLAFIFPFITHFYFSLSTEKFLCGQGEKITPADKDNLKGIFGENGSIIEKKGAS